MPGGSGSRAKVMKRHERHGLVVEIGKLLHISLTVLLMALLKLSDKALLDGVRTYPPLKLLPVDLVPNLNVCQCGQGGLKLRQEVVGMAGCCVRDARGCCAAELRVMDALPGLDGSHHSTTGFAQEAHVSRQNSVRLA